MAVTSADIDRGVEILKTFGASKVWLFGSALTRPGAARDLDLACEGLADSDYYRAVAKLTRELGVSVDLVHLSIDSPRRRFIANTGKLIYAA